MTPEADSGLTSAEAARRLAELGPNTLARAPRVRFLAIVREEVTEPMILLLLVVGIVYSVWGRLEDAITIFVVISLLVLAEVWNEFRAKKAIAALTELTAPQARVFRDGTLLHVPASEVVTGDVLVVTPGTRVAADATVAETTTGLSVDESSLTGESFPAAHSAGDPLFAGTTVLAGEAEAFVTAVGAATRLGRLAEKAAAIKPPRTPLQLAMRSLSGKLVYVAVFFSVLIPVIGVLRGQPLRVMILTGLSLSFATIPEELPIIITMVLGLGSYRLSKRGFLVKRLTAAETMGSVSAIVTDKTGTITESSMRLAGVFPAERRAEVLAGALGAVAPYEDTPIDRALREAGTESGLAARGKILRERELGDGGKTKAAIRSEDGAFVLYVTGAPEEVLSKCAEVPAGTQPALARETAAGHRVIAVASRRLPYGRSETPFADLERDMALAGFVSFVDPPRAGVSETVARTAAAGIRTIMVTGDHPATAAAIARQIGIAGEGSRGMVGADLAELGDAELRGLVRRVSVFARATPEDKYRIVQALQSDGHVVAVTGDGVNDALALQAADIGIAMGRRGTDVARETADVVLADDDYVTIAEGVFTGRMFFDNLRKGVKYYLSVKIALVLVFLLPVLAGLPLPFSPIQIILLELFMDLAASAGFVAEPAERTVYTRQPQGRDADIFGGGQIADVMAKGVLLFGAVTAVYLFARFQGFDPASVRTLAFASWIVGHVTLAFFSRSDTEMLLELGPFRNPVIDSWAVAAGAFLLVAVYTPRLGALVGLFPVEPVWLAADAVFTVAVLFLIELRKPLVRIHPETRHVAATHG
ncbi:MAG TPA: cation-transporting P-type ATPase [Coriobacteriia bacterium]|jgi:Ca2+-transporting ATPase